MASRSAEEEEEKALQQELRKAKARMKKHAKLQEWLKQKEERDREAVEAEHAEEEAKEQEEREKREKFERRAKAQRRKLEAHYKAQLEGLADADD